MSSPLPAGRSIAALPLPEPPPAFTPGIVVSTVGTTAILCTLPAPPLEPPPLEPPPLEALPLEALPPGAAAPPLAAAAAALGLAPAVFVEPSLPSAPFEPAVVELAAATGAAACEADETSATGLPNSTNPFPSSYESRCATAAAFPGFGACGGALVTQPDPSSQAVAIISHENARMLSSMPFARPDPWTLKRRSRFRLQTKVELRGILTRWAKQCGDEGLTSGGGDTGALQRELETIAQEIRERPLTTHARAEARIVVATASDGLDDGHHVLRTLRVVLREPFSKEILDLVR